MPVVVNWYNGTAFLEPKHSKLIGHSAAYLIAFFGLLVVCSSALKLSGQDDIVVKLSKDQIVGHEGKESSRRAGEWLEAPWGDVYQFRAGHQNWLVAREHCLSMNADLLVIKNETQLDWILSHYAPLSTRFSPRLIQVGLLLPEGHNRDWQWVDGSKVEEELSWAAGEPFDHSNNGRERCGLLNIEARRLDDVDCEASDDSAAQRYICQRNSDAHKTQQKSNNYIWGKIEQLFNFFGIGTAPTTTTQQNKTDKDYIDEVEENDRNTTFVTTTIASNTNKWSDDAEQAEVEAILSKLPKPLAEIERKKEVESKKVVPEGSGASAEVKETTRVPARAHATRLKEISDAEGSGAQVDKSNVEEVKEFIQVDDPKKLDKMIKNMEDMITSLDLLTVTENKSDQANISRTTVGAKKPSTEAITPTHAPEAATTESQKLEASIQAREELDNTVVAGVLEDDFDEEKTKDMPKAEITPPHEKLEDCDNSTATEGSGSESIKLAGSEEESLEDEEALQKLEITTEREEHVKEFLGVLRRFLERAERGDLKKLLDDKSGKTLLQRMRDAIREANRREFQMMEHIEELKSKGEKTEEIENRRMPALEQEELYKKISSVVYHAAEKEADKKGALISRVSSREQLQGPKKRSRSSAAEGSGDELQNELKDYYGDYLDNNEITEHEEKLPKKSQRTTKLIKKTLPTTTSASVTSPSTSEVPTSTESSPNLSNAEAEKKALEKIPNEASESSEDKTEESETSKLNVDDVTKPSDRTTIEASEATTEAVETTADVGSEEPNVGKNETTTTSTIGALNSTTTADETTTSSLAGLEDTKLEGLDDEEVKTKAISTTEPSTTAKTGEKSEFEKRIDTTEILRAIKDKEQSLVSKVPEVPTIAPFSLPPLPTLPTLAPFKPPTGTPFPPLPTLEDLLTNLNSEFKKLLAPPKPLG
ncbi:unnamed protein product [Caenorhabditis auriculariae]|uniref:C-type lectin domain-containing protein n=1 Tax=Caenorhabditis auriculariae TaxID=2777116 RepID=A0A8S1H8U3_9PELO|nr:unnamed protein product [Caenorhabditis auriculariae]